jgi:hypothetical protein
MYQSQIKKIVSDPYIFVKAVWCWKKLEIFPLLGHYAAWNGSFYRRFGTSYRSHFQGSSSPKVQISFTPRRKPEDKKKLLELYGHRMCIVLLTRTWY